MRAAPFVEFLEDRIAPAALTISVSGKSASFTDTNGDLVTVTTTKGTFTSAQFVFDPSATGQLAELILQNHGSFNNGSLAFSVTPNPAGGGSDKVNIGYINASGLSLNSVTLPGDLGRIDVGGGSSSVALGTLTVDSLGVQGAATQHAVGLSPSTASNIVGTAKLINIAGDLDGSIVSTNYQGQSSTGDILALNIGGSIDGSHSDGSTNSLQLGEVSFTGHLKKAVISGGLLGGASPDSGSVVGGNAKYSYLTSIKVLGSVPNDPDPNPLPGAAGTSILGGSGYLSGSVSATVISHLSVAGDVRGGIGLASAVIQGQFLLGDVQIAGSLIGANISNTVGDGKFDANIFGKTINSVVIGGDVAGGSCLDSARIFAVGTLQKAVISGSVYGGSAGQSYYDTVTKQTTVTPGYSGLLQGHAIGSVTISGSLVGGNVIPDTIDATINGHPSVLDIQLGTHSGNIVSATTIKSVTLGKNLQGGSGGYSGVIVTTAGGLNTLTIGGASGSTGSIVGGSGATSGVVRVGTVLGKLSLTHDLTGGSGNLSGAISVGGQANSISIGGNVTGGIGDSSANIDVDGLLKSLTIAGNFTGGNGGSTLLTNSAYVQAGTLTSLKIGGALTSGTPGSGGEDTCGAIRASHTIGSVTVGSIVGNAANPAIISAVGPVKATHTDVAIHSVHVNGTCTYADILAGYNTDTTSSKLGGGVNADAQIGSVFIGGNLSASNIVAGVGPGVNGFGTASSAKLSGAGVSDLGAIVSKISSIIVKGSVTPSAAGGDAFGLAAQNLVSVSVNGSGLTLQAGAENDTFAAAKDIPLPNLATGDTFAYEVSA